MNIFKKILIGFSIGIGSLILLFIIAGIGYKIIFSQKKAATFKINTESSKKHILIATQGSKFKNELVKKILDEYKNKDVYIKVIDVSLLKDIKSSDWNNVLILNSIEANKLSSSVEDFILKNKKNNNLILVAISGSGKWNNNNTGIDSITSASTIKKINNIKNQIITKLN